MAEATLGGAAPGGPADSGRGLSLEKAGKNTREEEVLPPWTHLFWLGGPWWVLSFFSAWPAAHFPPPVTARPPAGRAGRGGFVDGKGSTAPKAFPLGEGAPVRHHTGADEGATHPTRQEKGRHLWGDRSLLLQGKVGYRIAPHQSPSVTASPRGSLWAVQPYTKKRPKSGHVHGHRTSPSTGTMRPTTPKRASGNERA